MLHGRAAERAAAVGVVDLAVSLTHEDGLRGGRGHRRLPALPGVSGGGVGHAAARTLTTTELEPDRRILTSAAPYVPAWRSLCRTQATPESSSFEEAERAAFRASTAARRARPRRLAARTDRSPQDIRRSGSIDPAGSATVPIARPAGRRLPATSPEGDQLRPWPPAEDVRPCSRRPRAIQDPSSERPAGAPGVRGSSTARRYRARIAPSDTTRRGAVADDFFDAPVRRVEGDR